MVTDDLQKLRFLSFLIDDLPVTAGQHDHRLITMLTVQLGLNHSPSLWKANVLITSPLLHHLAKSELNGSVFNRTGLQPKINNIST